MTRSSLSLTLLLTAALLGGCASDGNLFTRGGSGNPTPLLATSSWHSINVTDGPATGTFVGTKVAQLRDELRLLLNELEREHGKLARTRGTIATDAQRYHGTVAAINARLQMGTTPGNPQLQRLWKKAQGELDQLSSDVAQVSDFNNFIGNAATMAGFLDESVDNAFNLAGAVEEDHRQLRVLRDEINQTMVLIDSMRNEVSRDVSRQQRYIQGERATLDLLASAIKQGQPLGQGLGAAYSLSAPGPLVGRTLNEATLGGGDYFQTGRAGGAFLGAAPGGFGGGFMQDAKALGSPAMTYAATGGGMVGDAGIPLVTIRFDRANVPYEDTLFAAMREALARAPMASVEVVGVAPQVGRAGAGLSGNMARREAERVRSSLIRMGLPEERIQLATTSSPGVDTDEVRVYVR